MVNNSLFCTVFANNLSYYKTNKMEIEHTIKDLQAGLSAMRAQSKKVGLVPTMGALHAGHAS